MRLPPDLRAVSGAGASSPNAGPLLGEKDPDAVEPHAISMNQPLQTQPRPLGLRSGELVRVRSVLEIAPTLDVRGSLDGMPFMPEMLQYCGGTFRVSSRADKTCAGDGAPRRMPNAVHLGDLRCDGAAHGGCEAACKLFWNEAWLERVETRPPPSRTRLQATTS